MKLFFSFLILLISVSLPAEEKLADHLYIERKGGIKKIIRERYFRVLTTKNSFDYYIYQGVPKGIQLEMAKLLKKSINKRYASKKASLNIQFEMIPVETDQLIPMLKEGKGDIIAAGLTVTPERKKHIRFAKPYRYVDEVIVTRKDLLEEDFRGKDFHIRKSTAFYNSIKKFNHKYKKNKQFRINIKEVDETLHTENILELVSLGKFDYTIADSYIAEMATKIFDNLVILKARPFGKKLPIAWAVRKSEKRLAKEINLVMPKLKKGTKLGNIFSRKYFKDFGGIKARLKGETPDQISPYDDLIKKYSKMYNFDWRLMAALCYQESRFIQDLENEWGAIGLFQVKQMTANEPYVNIPNIKGPKNAENNIHAGIKYLAWIRDKHFGKIKGISEKAKIRMAMAAYNAGPTRVLRAIKRAKKMGLDPKKWFRHVEYGMLRLKRIEPISYVSEINKRYVSYMLLGIPK